jgi:hypothetical protein
MDEKAYQYGDHDWGCQCDKCKVEEYAVKMELAREEIEVAQLRIAELERQLDLAWQYQQKSGELWWKERQERTRLLDVGTQGQNE